MLNSITIKKSPYEAKKKLINVPNKQVDKDIGYYI